MKRLVTGVACAMTQGTGNSAPVRMTDCTDANNGRRMALRGWLLQTTQIAGTVLYSDEHAAI